MATLKNGTRLQVGSAAWIGEERSSASQIVEQEAEEFTFSARNEVDWLNEHMAEIFNENQINLTEIYKTPGKLRGKTPRTAHKRNLLETRAPLTDVFSATPRAVPSPVRPQLLERPAPKFQIAQDNPSPPKTETPRAVNFLDSGYHGSQATLMTEPFGQSPQRHVLPKSTALGTPAKMVPTTLEDVEAEERRATEESFQSAKEELNLSTLVEEDGDDEDTVMVNTQKAEGAAQVTVEREEPRVIEAKEAAAAAAAAAQEEANSSELEDGVSSPVVISPRESPVLARTGTPQKQSPINSAISPEKTSASKGFEESSEDHADRTFEDVHSPSVSSSPMRPIVRKSSLNFAALPAREPLTTKKSIGARTSRTSHLDQTRTSYYPRHTGGKSIGGHKSDEGQDDDDIDVELEEPESSRLQSFESSTAAVEHNKTSTQRLQDQISMLGKLQAPPRSSRSIPGVAAPLQSTAPAVLPTKDASPKPSELQHLAPGAFPDDEEDSWIGPSTATNPTPFATTPRTDRPNLVKSHTAAVMQNLHGDEDDDHFDVSMQRSPAKSNLNPNTSPSRHFKATSATVHASPNKVYDLGSALKKSASVSKDMVYGQDPPRSPTRSIHNSPLKAAKDKLSSMFKSSRGLFASSAVVSAEARTEAASTARSQSSRMLEDVFEDNPSAQEPLYPTLDVESSSPAPLRRTRASTEREEKQRAREIKEQRMMDEQLEKLEKLREKENKKARIFSQEEKDKVSAVQKELERKEPLVKSAEETTNLPRSTRSSPRKTKAQIEAEQRAGANADADANSGADTEADHNGEDTLDTKAVAPSATRPGMTGIAKLSNTGKRIAKPPLPAPKRGARAAPAPTQIRVLTGARAPLQHPSNSILAAGLGESLASSSMTSFASSQSSTRGGPPSLNNKISNPSFGRSTGKKPAAILAAEKKREADEREAQKRLDLKLENQRKRAAEAEERKLEEARLEAERKRELRQQAANKKTEAQRQILERAKNERPPPPPTRPQKDQESFDLGIDKQLPPVPGPSRPASRMDLNRPQPSTMNKAPPKRPYPQESDDLFRPVIQRNGPSYTQNADKRRRTGEELNDEPAPQSHRPHIGAPIRQSSVRQQQKDLPSKSIFSNGYASVAGPSGPGLSQQAQRLAQAQAKATHPTDMAYTSKAQINFAPSTSTQASSHRTPARTAPNGVSKQHTSSKARSSPRYQNGESIDLPEINTDESESDSGDDTPDPAKKKGSFADWVDSPALRAGLLAQETIDPMSVFGPPQELRMEEVFRNKERWGKFRQRTSSAVWTQGPGGDALTAEEVERDKVARERLQREGGWSYGLS